MLSGGPDGTRLGAVRETGWDRLVEWILKIRTALDMISDRMG